MAINATNESTPRELIPAGNYIARCYQMLQIGTVTEVVNNESKTMHKVRIGWELPEELKTFKEENGPQPLVISNEYTLSLHEKSNLRKMLASWRGADFTAEQAKSFDITALLGVPCMINIIHKPSQKDSSKVYEQIGSVSAMPKGVKCPPQINPTFILSYDAFDKEKFGQLPEFIRNRMATSQEYQFLINPPEPERQGMDALKDETPANTFAEDNGAADLDPSAPPF